MMISCISFDQIRVKILAIPQKFDANQLDIELYFIDETERIIEMLNSDEDRKFKN